jgi:hypothetical protein
MSDSFIPFIPFIPFVGMRFGGGTVAGLGSPGTDERGRCNSTLAGYNSQKEEHSRAGVALDTGVVQGRYLTGSGRRLRHGFLCNFWIADESNYRAKIYHVANT